MRLFLHIVSFLGLLWVGWMFPGVTAEMSVFAQVVLSFLAGFIYAIILYPLGASIVGRIARND